MDISEIKLNWRMEKYNKKANINLWNSKADYFGNYEIPKFKDDKFLNLLFKNNLLNEESNILDVGCGGGKYTLAISEKCKSITGIDLSPKMIEYANENKEKFKIHNAFFKKEDWHELDIRKSSYYKKYDLVYASMTPAVQSYDTFEKLIQASKGYCLVRCNTKRSDSVLDEIKKVLNIKNTNNQDLNFMYAFNALWLEGYLPKIDYEEKHWISNEPLNKACDLYIKRILSIRDIDKSEEVNIINYLKGISKDGYIKEDIRATISTLYWNVK